MLVLTFTEAAAEQMRSRIAGQLNTAFEAGHDRHIRNQLMLLPAADISTIHAFCKRLIAENFYQLGIDPAFGIIDADEQKLLKTEVLNKRSNGPGSNRICNRGSRSFFTAETYG